MRNRRERLLAAPAGRGVCCDWRWTSDLHIARVFPTLPQSLGPAPEIMSASLVA
jgi:hypothetical protein